MRRRAVAAALLAAVALLALVAGPGSGGAAAAQGPLAEPAFLTLVNPTARSRTVFLDTLEQGGEVAATAVYFVAAGRVRTVVLDLPGAPGAEPADFVVRCGGCATLRFGLAAGQRALALVVAPTAAAAGRADLRLVNESSRIQSGLLRTGAAVGAGRPVAQFRLAPGESLDLGLRLADGQALDFNLDCDTCLPQRARLGNGVDLEIVIR